MDANQLIKALGDVVAVAKPPQEYCFLWIDWWATCMTKAEWSGWMQAMGATLSIILAISLPYLQARSAHIKNYRMAKNCLLHQSGAVHALAVFAQVSGDPLDALRRARETIDTVVQSYSEVRPSDLPRGALPSWLGARTSASQLMQAIEIAGRSGRPSASVTSVIEGYRATADSCLSEFSKFDPSLFAKTKRWFTRWNPTPKGALA